MTPREHEQGPTPAHIVDYLVDGDRYLRSVEVTLDRQAITVGQASRWTADHERAVRS